jgi:hypothetical protein
LYSLLFIAVPVALPTGMTTARNQHLAHIPKIYRLGLLQVERREEGDNPQSTFLYEYQPQVADVARVSAGARSLCPPAVSMVMKHRTVRAVASGGANPALGWLQITSLLQSRIESGDAGGLDVVTRGPALGSIAGKAAEIGDMLTQRVLGIKFSFLGGPGICPRKHCR